MDIRRWLASIEPFRLTSDCAEMIIIAEGGDAELGLRQKIAASDRLLAKWTARMLLFKVCRHLRERSILGTTPTQLAANDPASFTPPIYPGNVRNAG